MAIESFENIPFYHFKDIIFKKFKDKYEIGIIYYLLYFTELSSAIKIQNLMRMIFQSNNLIKNQ